MPHLPFFPTPYPNELFYSTISRYHYLSRNLFISWTFEDLFLNAKNSINIDYPSHLNYLRSKLSENCTLNPEAIINNHSLFPLFKPFLPSEQAELVRKYMKGENTKSIGMTLGISQGKINNPKFLRFCNQCYHDNIDSYGESYWLTVHQLPGVFVCPFHNEILLESPHEVRTTYALRHLHLLQRIDLDSSTPVITAPYHLNHLKNISQETLHLLKMNYSSVGLNELKERYLFYLRKKDLATFNGQVKEKKILKQFITFYGENFLGLMESPVNLYSRNNWITNIFKMKKVHPLRHILFIHFLGLTVDEFLSNPVSEFRPFGEGPWVCFNAASGHYNQAVITNCRIKRNTNGNISGTFTCVCGFTYSRKGPDSSPKDINKVGLILSYGEVWEQELIRLRFIEKRTIKSIADFLKVTRLTVTRKLKKLSDDSVSNSVLLQDSDKNIEITDLAKKYWINVLLANPGLNKTELRRLAEREYIWLYRHDKKWLNENSPSSLKKFSTKEVNYSKSKDEELSNKILLMAQKVMEEKDPVRITKSFLGRKLAVNFQYLKGMPKSKVAIDSVVETIEEFQLRRLEYVAQELYLKGEHLSISKVKKAAGLQQKNLSKKVIKKIEETVLGKLSN
ncbi:TnsD family Tn7-like transposition protein [Cytobacillus firmus]